VNHDHQSVGEQTHYNGAHCSKQKTTSSIFIQKVIILDHSFIFLHRYICWLCSNDSLPKPSIAIDASKCKKISDCSMKTFIKSEMVCLELHLE